MDRAEVGRLIQEALDATGLRQRVQALMGSGKVAFPFAAGWANTAVGQEGASYTRQGQVVWLQGSVTKTSGAPASGDLIGTLPAGFRPSALLTFPVVGGPGVNIFGVLLVHEDGRVRWFSGSAAETDYTSLSGVSFVVA